MVRTARDAGRSPASGCTTRTALLPRSLEGLARRLIAARVATPADRALQGPAAAGAAAGAGAILTRAETSIDAAMRGWGDLYHPTLV